jgi:hypothetical protein
MSAPEIAFPIEITTYFVVPVVRVTSTEPIQPNPPPASQTQLCLYFRSDWSWVQPGDVPINLPSSPGVNFVGFVQPPAAQAGSYIPEGYRLEGDATLLAGVAKTLTASGHPPATPQPNVFVASTASGNPTLVLPVSDDTRRGVILIFMSPNGVNVTKLLATTDPEISNSTGTLS